MEDASRQHSDADLPLHDSPEAYSKLGIALAAESKLDQAIAAFRKSIELNPRSAADHTNLGVVLRTKRMTDEAIAAHRKAIELDPNHATAHNNLGNALRDRGDHHAAIAAFQKAIALNPTYAKALTNLGNALSQIGQLEQAALAHADAIKLAPLLAEAHHNLGVVLTEQHKLEAAIAALRRAIELKPDFAEPHLNLAFILLAQGHFKEGWEEFEWRLKCDEPTEERNSYPQPQWNGEDLRGRTLLIHAEQGAGDTVQFIRYLPQVVALGGTVLVACRAELVPLFTPLAQGCRFISEGQALPPFDMHCPLMSLPGVMGTTLDSIPGAAPYLQADLAAKERWQQLIGGGSALKVGLGWAGNPEHKTDRLRSMDIAQLAPLARVPGVQFFSLQKRAPGARAQARPPQLPIADWTELRKDFADTASLIASLDLVISVDTAVAHIAGALGKPVWTMLSFAPDWRWLTDRLDSPWYPTMRLFRQKAWGDWGSVISDVADALMNCSATAAKPPPAATS